MTTRWIETRWKDWLSRFDTLADEAGLVMAGAPVDLEWWVRRLKDARTRLDLIAPYMGDDRALAYDMLDVLAAVAATMATGQEGDS